MKTILTIDDSADTRSLHKLIFELEGFNVVVASSAEEAFKLIDGGEQIDLILCDIHMPKLDGYQFVERFKLNYADAASKTPIVFTSSDEVSVPDGVVGQIRKMTHIDLFVSKVRSFIG